MNLQEKFERFKQLTNEEVKIIDIIRKNTKIESNTKILEVGSNKGNISKSLQPKKQNITCIDINEIDFEPEINFIKNKWEDVKIKEKFDIVIASHVWGHFHYSNTTSQALKKIILSKNKSGKIFLCFNTNEDFLSELIKLGKKLFKKFQFDYFDEKIIENLDKEEINFSVELKTNTFQELTELMQVLLIAEEEFEDKKEEITKFLKEKLEKPKFKINQKLIILK